MTIRDTLNRSFGALHTRTYAATRGRLGATMRGAPVILVTTTGRQSGLPRTHPLIALRNGDDWIVVASNGGQDRHPAWYLNLLAQPMVKVQVGDQVTDAVASVVADADREALWAELDRLYAGYAGYRAKTDRTIPVVRLRPAAHTT